VRRAVLGAVVIALYIGAAFLGRTPVRTLFDGSGPPQPYQWVSPPPDFEDSNTKPKPFGETVAMTKDGITGASLQTDDGQATVIVPERSFSAKAGAKAIRFRIVPLDAKTVKAPPKDPQGNAYRITARYIPSQEEAEPAQNITVLLRYPAHGTDLYRLDGTRWTLLKGESIESSLQIYANTKRLGVFVAAGATPTNRRILWYITGGISVVAAILGIFLGLRERRARPGRRRH
jgi:hypothetical protein